MKLIELTQLFWNKSILTLVALFTFIVVSTEFILPKINSNKFSVIIYSFLMMLIVISGVIQNLEEAFKKDKE